MPLPTCQCVAGQPPFSRLSDIFCALGQIDLECVIPTLVSATIDGSTVVMVFSEEVTGTGAGFILNDEFFLTLLSGSGTNTLTFDADFVATEGQEVLMDYTPGNIASGPECPLAAFSDFEVSNNTGVTFLRLTSSGDFRVTSGADNRAIT